MVERTIMHATLIVLNGKGILLTGKSGSGKSDLALRLIENKGAELVADDAVELGTRDGNLIGKAPENLAGLLEVRGVGIVNYPYKKEATVDLIAVLSENSEKLERLPLLQKEVILGLEINKIDLYAKENSAPDKIVVALRMFGI